MPSFAPRRQQAFPTTPIPGTEPPPRALFVDRWGTLFRETGGSATQTFEQLEFTPGAVDALFRASRAGWKVYLVGNEDAVARGTMSDATWSALENALLEHLRARGVVIQRNYACLDHPQNGKGAHKKNSVFRFPETGVFFHAAQNDGIALQQSWVIGDGTLELVAGTRAGCRALGVRTGLAVRDRQLDCEPDAHADDLSTAIELFLSSEAYVQR